jgi:cyclopropane fatty-acyl-phospholipid synthase-like methyltransferase
LPTTSPTPQPSPALFFETVGAYQRTASLKTAIELEVFTAIGEGRTSAKELAERCKTSERGMRILCDCLTVIGFLTKAGNRYGLTPDTAMFLDRRSPAYLGTAVEFLTSKTLMDGFKDIAAAVRKGGTAISEEGTMAPEHPVWVEFARSMAPAMALPAELTARLVGVKSGQRCKVLDIAAGHGLFGIAVARKNPLAEIVALDWPNVLDVAKENAQAAGLAGRYRTIEGSAFEADYGSGFDLVLLTNFLHHFDVTTCEKLLRKVHATLGSGGRAVTLEFVPNEDRVSPPPAATFSMVMLATTASGDAYTFSEFERMFRNAGFSRSELRPLPPTFEQVIISHR